MLPSLLTTELGGEDPINDQATLMLSLAAWGVFGGEATGESRGSAIGGAEGTRPDGFVGLFVAGSRLITGAGDGLNDTVGKDAGADSLLMYVGDFLG